MKLSHKYQFTLCALLCLGLCLITLSSADALSTGVLDQTGLDKELGGKDINIGVFIGQIIKTLLGFLAMVATLLILYGGFKWMTAGGDAKKVDTAKSILKNAVIGLVLILCSLAITVAVFDFALTALNGGSGATGSGTPPASNP